MSPNGNAHDDAAERRERQGGTTDPTVPHAIVGSYVAGSMRGRGTVDAPATNWPVFIISGLGVLAVAAYAFFGRASAERTLGDITGWISTNLGWFYIFTATVAVVFMIGVAVAKTGRVRLGPDHARPQFGLFSWSAMLFAAGIGVDLLFFSVAEPVTQYFGPPVGDGETREAAENAVVFALFHYGVTGWALYALMGMAFGYFAYRLNMPLAIRSALYPLIGRRIHGPVGDAVDIAAMLGTVFGIAASLGIGVVQLNYGLKILLGVPEGATAQTALIVVAVGVATVSAVSGVDKGIKRLSEINVLLAVALMVYVVVTGRTAFLFDGLVMNIGDYVSSFPGMTLDTYAFSDDPEHTKAWLGAWTLFFWAWWVAWAPFVGLFLARISRGRTLRQFVVGTLTIPFVFVLLWMSFFGNSAIERVRGGDAAFGAAAVDEPQRGFYDLLSQYPGAGFLIGLATLIGLLLYITSADSGALVMSNFTSRITDNRQDGPVWSRIFWAALVGVLTITMLQVDGITTVQSATIVMGLPFTVVIYLIMYSLFTSLRLEAYQTDARAVALHGAMSGRTDENWEDRLDRAVALPSDADIRRYLAETARPALEEVAHALERRGQTVQLLTSAVPDGATDQLDLEVTMAGERDFRYQLYPVEHRIPGFTGAGTAAAAGGAAGTGTATATGDGDPASDGPSVRAGDRSYYRLEVYDLTGSLGYDVYGYSRRQLINNVLDLYERHLEFLHMQRDLPGSSDLSDGAEPVRTWETWDED